MGGVLKLESRKNTTRIENKENSYSSGKARESKKSENPLKPKEINGFPLFFIDFDQK